ncbi:MAG TPA: M48 family metalloprotease [Woeseiaceae bacterium]|nr:M48 family metalloprotease [Woeseiaceae bacterium]
MHPFIGAWIPVVVAVAVLAGCAVNPVTGERQLALISEAQEIQMGREAARQVKQTVGLVENEALQAYVNRIGQELAADSERPSLPWSFAVLDDPTPNAFALPGGFIFITRGLLSLLNSEAELATVLGHEIGHVTARHSVTMLSRAQLAQLGLTIGSILYPELGTVRQLAGAGLQLLFLSYGRDAERQADRLGFSYALSEGYDVRHMAEVFVALRRAGDLKGRSALPAWLTTHPAPEDRIEAVQERLQNLEGSLAQAEVGQEQYLQIIEGLTYGQSPQQGFFRDGVFYHPALGFRFAVPANWQTQNLARAVVAASPERNAAVELTLVPDEPAAAARQFLGQQGLRANATERQRIHGVPALVSLFEAQTHQGPIRGYAAFLGYGGETYRFIAYASAPDFDRYDATFEQIISSFAPLTDPGILNLQPPQIEIVQIDESLTLAEFDERYPSTIPLDELAVINQVAGPDAVLEPGTLVKRVV